MKPIKNLNSNGVHLESYLSYKPPKMPSLDENLRCVRHIPRNSYNLITIDALLRYLYKYQFDRYCREYEIFLETPSGRQRMIALEVYDSETDSYKEKRYKSYKIVSKEHYSAVSELITVLYNIFEYNYKWVDFFGFPVKRAGFVCQYEGEKSPYFTAKITLRFVKSEGVNGSNILEFSKGID